MRRVVWRFLVLIAYAFWQGGFLFYTAEVVPIGAAVLGSSTHQGFITRVVALRMNQVGIVALSLFALDLWISRDRSSRRRWSRAIAWIGIAVSLALLFFLHPRLDSLLDHTAIRVDDYDNFYPLHRLYLWTSTIQWFFGLAYLVLTLAAWREDDAISKGPH